MGQTTFGEPLNYKVSQNAAAIEADEEAMAILATGDTHIAIGAGKYVYVRDHSTLARGLYKNTSGSTIAANGPLSSSNLTATTEGGLNELNSNITTLQEEKQVKFTKVSKTYSLDASGNADVSDKVGDNKTLAFAEAGSGWNASPYKTSAGKWRVKVWSNSGTTFQVLANGNTTITMYYF